MYCSYMFTYSQLQFPLWTKSVWETLAGVPGGVKIPGSLAKGGPLSGDWSKLQRSERCCEVL